MILEQETFESFGYYPSELTYGSIKPILAACNDCRKIRKTSKNNYRTMCPSCAKGGTRNPMFGRAGIDAPNYKYGKVTCMCLQCKKKFYVNQYKIDHDGGKYCCRKCRNNAFKKDRIGIGNPFFERSHTAQTRTKQREATIKHMHDSPLPLTAPEKAFKEICKKHNLPFVCNVDAKKRIGNAIPDFIHIGKKIVVEVYGDYWHSAWGGFNNLKYKHTVEGRTNQLNTEGYKSIFVWESDIMRKDADKFVLHLMQKAKIIGGGA